MIYNNCDACHHVTFGPKSPLYVTSASQIELGLLNLQIILERLRSLDRDVLKAAGCDSMLDELQAVAINLSTLRDVVSAKSHLSCTPMTSRTEHILHVLAYRTLSGGQGRIRLGKKVDQWLKRAGGLFTRRQFGESREIHANAMA